MEAYKRHELLYKVLRTILSPIFRRILRFEYAEVEGPDVPSIVVANHNVDLDPVMLGMAFKRHMYFVASEHVYRWGWKSRLLGWAIAPIARQKGDAADARAVKQVLREIRKGRNIALFPEGNRSFFGVTMEIPPSTAKMVKVSGAALITYKIEGGYLASPRWSSSMRKGCMQGYVVNMYMPEELANMSVQEIHNAMERDLYEDAYATQARKKVRFIGKGLAEGLETALYLCPACKTVGSLRGIEDVFACSCGMRARYSEYGMLEGEGLPFFTVTQWARWQQEELSKLVEDETFCLSDPNQQLHTVISAVGNSLLVRDTLQMNKEQISCGAYTIPMDNISNMAIYGRMVLVFSTKDGMYYEVKSDKPRSAVKYLAYYQLLKKKSG